MIGGAIADGTHGTNYHWLEGGLGGAPAGFFVSCVALAVADGVEATKGSRRTKWYMRIRVPMQIRSRSRCHRELAKAGLSGSETQICLEGVSLVSGMAIRPRRVRIAAAAR